MNAIRRFWSAIEVEAAYETIFTAYNQRLSDVTVIIGKSSESDSATGQVVVQREDYREWMSALEARLAEIAAEASGSGELITGSTHVDFSKRRVRT